MQQLGSIILLAALNVAGFIATSMLLAAFAVTVIRTIQVLSWMVL